MKKLNQKGFSAVEGLLSAIIVLLIVFVGYYIYHAQSKTTDTYNSSSEVAQNAVVTPKAAASKTVYSKVPTSLQTAILDQTKKDAPSCVKGSQLVDENGSASNIPVVYDAAGFATTPIGCGGGANYLFAKVGDNWVYVDSTQEAFSCSKLTQYKVPVAFLRLAQAGSANTAECAGATTLQTYK